MDILSIIIINNLDTNAIIAIALYVGLAGAYLLVIPAATLFYLNQRWYTARSVERLLMYFMVFMFFPGILLLSPFVNLRPRPREV
ncbi:MAG: NAD(P)H-quinone oxidoreductase subunit L [Leptolyngbyaceae bacterium]|nr:NAD(P)H-quinone oxidoreductase subunit L [Leptolyngbyaceae bacterium]